MRVWQCTIDGCGKDALAGRVCKEHFVAAVSESRKSTALHLGCGSISTGGYVFVRAPDVEGATASGTMQEHRLIMSLLLGRPLRSDENVHHKNGDRGDNRPSNLELWVKPQPAGQRVEDVIAWAKDILKRYRNFDKSPTIEREPAQLTLLVGGKSVVSP